MALLAVFDFLSHAAMHLPFNEAYLRTLRSAFPGDIVVFYGTGPHVAALSPLLADEPSVRFRAIDGFRVPFGLSRHNPVGGYLAARACLGVMRQKLAGQNVRLGAVLGADANLHDALRTTWPGISGAMLHVIVHNHVAAAVGWRSRNPVLRHFDLQSRLRSPLPANMRLVALELGIADAIGRLAPALRGSVDTLEHPILVSEWADGQSGVMEGPLRIGFLGHASADKGFRNFAGWALAFAGSDRSFHAIGLAAPETASMDLGGLATPPSSTSVPRPAYVAALAACDLICLPLSPAYEYVASGSVIDAIAALKPLYSISNGSLVRMRDRYGPFGMLASGMEELGVMIGDLTRPVFSPMAEAWTESLRGLRAARTPECLAPAYAALIGR